MYLRKRRNPEENKNEIVLKKKHEKIILCVHTYRTNFMDKRDHCSIWLWNKDNVEEISI